MTEATNGEDLEIGAEADETAPRKRTLAVAGGLSAGLVAHALALGMAGAMGGARAMEMVPEPSPYPDLKDFGPIEARGSYRQRSGGGRGYEHPDKKKAQRNARKKNRRSRK